MALFMPSNIVPDARNGLGYGVIDADRTWSVSWRVNGASALVAFQVSVYDNTIAGTLVYSTGKISDGCPFYGTTNTGVAQTFSYTMPMISSMANGNSYKMIITQWWGSTDAESVTQNSASVFYCRSNPTIAIDTIGTNGVVTDKKYTFNGIYSQTDGDVLNWFRWRIASADDLDNPLYDSGNISGTMDIESTYDGLFTGQNYAVRLNIQTQNGVEADTGWVTFSVDYGEPIVSTEITAKCADGTNAVLVSWTGNGPGALVTPSQSGTCIYNGQQQSPTWNNYDPNRLTIGGQTSGIDAGNYVATFTPKNGYNWGQTMGVVAWSIYRKDANVLFIHLADVNAGAGELYDYGAASRQGPYTYYAFPIDAFGSVISAPIQSESVNPCFSSWSLMECANNGNGFSVVSEYLFKYNFSSGAISNNNKPNISQNFTRYPTLQRAPQNYRSGSLSSLIGVVDRDTAKYSDTLSMRDRLFALSTTQNTLFLKSRKGDIVRVGISEAIEAKTADATFQQTQTVSLSWVEIGSTDNLLKLTALDNAASGEEVNSPNLVLEPSSAAIQIGETLTVDATWLGNGVLSVAPTSGENVSISNDTITVVKTSTGRSVIPVSVSPTAQYTGQTVALTVEATGIPIDVPTLSGGPWTYTGFTQTPTFVGYDNTKMTMSGATSATNAGNYTVIFKPQYGYMWSDGTSEEKNVVWTINKASPQLTVVPLSATCSIGETVQLSITRSGDGAVSIESSAPQIASVTLDDTSSYIPVNPPTQSNTLRYDGTSQSPTWNGYDTNIMTLSGTLSGTEPGSYPAIFTLADGYVWSGMPLGWVGTVLGLAQGNATITVSVAATQNYLADSATVSITVTA